MQPGIEKITLRGLLPDVFADDADRCSVRSEIWLRDITFERGRFYLISAESGTGKSSLCSYIYGSRRDYRGVIEFDGKDIRSLGIDCLAALRQRSLSFLPQDLKLFPELTVMENLDIKNRLTRCSSNTEISSMLSRLGLEGYEHRKCGLMSIGQQQRVAIVRALCQPFDFLILDEPVSHLDERNNLEAARLIAETASRQGAAVIATSVGNNLMLDSVIRLEL